MMLQRHARYMPVLERRTLMGVISFYDVARAVGAERSNVSRHLTVLLNAGILECRKDGLKMIYWLQTPCIMNFFSCVADVLKSQLAKNARVLQEL